MASVRLAASVPPPVSGAVAVTVVVVSALSVERRLLCGRYRLGGVGGVVDVAQPDIGLGQ